MFRAYTFLKNYKIFPAAGGLLKQGARFICSVEYMDLIFSKYEEIEQAEAEIKSRMDQNLQKSIKGTR